MFTALDAENRLVSNGVAQVLDSFYWPRRVCIAQRRSGEGICFTARGFLSLFFSCSIFSESSQAIGLKFGHNAWIGPEGDNKEFHRDSFCSFLIKNQKPP